MFIQLQVAIDSNNLLLFPVVFDRQLEQLEHRMVRDIGQILLLLQQQSPMRSPAMAEWSRAAPETSVDVQQQTGIEGERHKPTFMETRSSCSLPTVAESRAEMHVDSRQPNKCLSTQRSLDSASRYYTVASRENVYEKRSTLIGLFPKNRPGGESSAGRTRKTAFRTSPWLPSQARSLTYDPSTQTFGRA